MKKIYLSLFIAVILESCNIAYYDAVIHPANVQFNQPNFKYVKTIEGTAEGYHGALVWDNNVKTGLVNLAKKNMYANHNLSANQIITNVTVDITKEREPSTYYFGESSLRTARVVISADIYEFVK